MRPSSEEVVEIDRDEQLSLSQHSDVAIAAALGVDTAGPVEEVQQGIRRDAAEAARARYVAGHEDADRLRSVETRVDVHVVGVDGGDGLRDAPLDLAVARAEQLHRTDGGQEDIALPIDDQALVEVGGAPYPDADAVPGLHHVTRVQTVLAGTAEAAGEEIGAEWAQRVAIGEQRRGRRREDRIGLASRAGGRPGRQTALTQKLRSRCRRLRLGEAVAPERLRLHAVRRDE